MRKLRDSMPQELVQGEYHDTKAYALRDEAVVAEYFASNENWRAWPGKQKNVCYWVVLANGKAVGFNENISKGWSFPVISYRETPK